jgi:hypothetical protein
MELAGRISPDDDETTAAADRASRRGTTRPDGDYRPAGRSRPGPRGCPADHQGTRRPGRWPVRRSRPAGSPRYAEPAPCFLGRDERRCPAASRAFHSRMAAVSSASSSPCEAAARSRARRRRKSATGTTTAAWPPRWITSYQPVSGPGTSGWAVIPLPPEDDPRGLDIYLRRLPAHRDDVAASGIPCRDGTPNPGAASRMLIRTLASLTRFRGAKRGANDRRSRAPSGHAQPLPVRPSGMSGRIWHRQATFRRCLLSSRSRVRMSG